MIFRGVAMDYKTLGFEVKKKGDSGEFEGFASTSDLDQGGDIVVKGAFAKTLTERGSRVKMLWNHKSDMLPIGKFSMLEERDGGLYVKGKVADTTMGRDVKMLLADDAIDSMSIGFVPEDAEYNDEGVRLIRELKLYEVSLVNFPMNEKAVVTQVKNLFDVRELEAKLREVGYSNSQAKRMATASIKSLREVGDEEKALADLHSALENFNQTLRGY